MFAFICKRLDYGINGDYEVSADATDLKREAWNHRFEFQKRSQLFICAHNETLSVVAMCVCNPDYSPVGTNRWDAAPTPTGFAESVCSFTDC